MRWSCAEHVWWQSINARACTHIVSYLVASSTALRFNSLALKFNIFKCWQISLDRATWSYRSTSGGNRNRILNEIWCSINLSISFWRIICSEGNKFACLSCERAILSWKLDITGRCGGYARERWQCASKSFTCNTLSASRIAFILCEHGMPWTWLNAPVHLTWYSDGGLWLLIFIKCPIKSIR